MPEPVLGQLSSFLLFTLGGIALGVSFDVLRTVRVLLRPRGIISFMLDVLFWLTALSIVAPLLFAGTWGDLRLFVWLALLLGICYYLALLGGPCRPLVRGLVRLILALFRLPGRILHGAEYIRADPRRVKTGRTRE